ncbi:Protein of unknown function [Cotesia congregata]|uniref:Uncharacterized protein n=1 Tax=Cotesia congregata TaxID=51543 RepID=A0A8J2H7D6_COTCN|nr:Protein of unknown function [Cotesia congregata]
MLQQYDTLADRERTLKEQEELDEQEVQSIFGKKNNIINGKVLEEIIVVLPDEPPLKKTKTTEFSDNSIAKEKKSGFSWSSPGTR